MEALAQCYFVLPILHTTSSTLFPYTTLFRSNDTRQALPGVPSTGVALQKGSLGVARSEEHTSELQSLRHLVCRLLLEKKNDVRDEFVSVTEKLKNELEQRYNMLPQLDIKNNI